MVLESVHTFLESSRHMHERLHIYQSCLEVCDYMDLDLGQPEVVGVEGLVEGCGTQTCWGRKPIVRSAP